MHKLILTAAAVCLVACGAGVIGDCPECEVLEKKMRCAETSGCDIEDPPPPEDPDPSGPAIGSIMTYVIPTGQTLPDCFINGVQATKQSQVTAIFGPGCQTEIAGPDGLYVSRFYCATKTASADWNAWTSEACTPGCHYFRWSFIGTSPVSCKAL